jgi:hypothetical protein
MNKPWTCTFLARNPCVLKMEPEKRNGTELVRIDVPSSLMRRIRRLAMGGRFGISDIACKALEAEVEKREATEIKPDAAAG